MVNTSGKNDGAVLVKKYEEMIRAQLPEFTGQPQQVYSKEYELFRQELLKPQLNVYEKLCNFFVRFNIRIPSKDTELYEFIRIAHLNVNPAGVTSLAIVLPIFIMLFGVVVSIVFDLLFYVVFSLLVGIALIFVFLRIPEYTANSWRMRASNQMVLCIFYVITYMRHTSNLERAIDFAAQYLAPPLSLDMRKVLWDVEVQKFDTIRDSLEGYLETWRTWNGEFIESFHLVESSLFEGLEERRLNILDKALEIMLEGTKEKMLHYVQNLKSPITTLHMLGVILPILGLVVLPLVVNFSKGVSWWHIATLYNIILPAMVFYLGKNILSNRPTGYGDTDISELNPALKKYKNILVKLGKREVEINPLLVTIILGAFCFVMAITPVLLEVMSSGFDFDIGDFKFNDYRPSSDPANRGARVGPYGLGASIVSIFFPLSFALGIGLYAQLRSKNVIDIRERTKKLEAEFSAALFQLGNRLGDGLPAEIAFPKVAVVTQGTTSGAFFQLVSSKLSLGVGLEQAINESVAYFPSNVIRSSMKVLTESVRKGPAIAAHALLNVSRYIKEIHTVNERLKDLLADIISDMRSQISFLTPVIASIVIGITSMITFILSSLQRSFSGQTADGMPASTLTELTQFFGDGIPTYYFQLVVGVYVFQIVYILTVIANGVENGADKLNERYLIGRNTVRSTLLYCILAVALMVLFNVIASQISGVAGIIGKS